MTPIICLTAVFIPFLILSHAPPVSAENCAPNEKMDIMYVVDAGSSTGEENYRRIWQFLIRLTDYLHMSEDCTRVGVHTRDTRQPNKGLTKRPNGDKDHLQKVMNNTSYSYTRVETVLSINTAGTNLGIYSRSYSDYRKIILYVTDGAEGKPLLVHNRAKFLKDQGISFYTVAIEPDADPDEMQDLASQPDFCLLLEDFDELEKVEVVQRLARLLHQDSK